MQERVTQSFQVAPARLSAAAVGAVVLALAGVPEYAAAQLNIKEDNQWRYALGVGASFASGNSSSKSVNVTGDAVKASASDKWTLYGRLLYGEDNDQTTSDQVSAGVRYDWDISRDWFHFGILDWLRDRPANLDHRVSINSGLGYHLYKRDEGFWDIFAGLGYSQDDLVVRTEVSDQQRSNYGRAELLLGQQSEHKLSDTATLKQRLSYFPSLEDSDSYRGVFDTTLSVAVNRRFDLTASLNYRYNSQPGTGLDKVDVLFVTGFTVRME
jgi:putative salt-induced outer membrane protein YdiY